MVVDNGSDDVTDDGEVMTWFQQLVVNALLARVMIQPRSKYTYRCGIDICRHDGKWLGFVGPRGTPPTLARVCGGHHDFANKVAGLDALHNCFYAGVKDTDENARELSAFLADLWHDRYNEEALEEILADVDDELDAAERGSQEFYMLVVKVRATKHALSNFYGERRRRETRASRDVEAN